MDVVYWIIVMIAAHYILCKIKQIKAPSATTITQSSVVIGNSGNGLSIGVEPPKSEGEIEVVRVYQKLDIQHKAEFLIKLREYEEEYDAQNQ